MGNRGVVAGGMGRGCMEGEGGRLGLVAKVCSGVGVGAACQQVRARRRGGRSGEGTGKVKEGRGGHCRDGERGEWWRCRGDVGGG